MKKLQTLLLASAAAVVVTAAASSASANLITHQIAGNDCSGFFGTGFEACTIFIVEDNERVELSPVIAKYDFNDDGTLQTVDKDGNPVTNPELNTALYPSIDGTEFSYTGTATTSGTWSYTAGTDDPGVRYWVAKGGNNFLLHWIVSADAAAAGGVCADPSFFNLDCLNEALVVTGGTWSTPGGAGLSHLTFYDTEIQVPEPATLGLLGIGLLGAGYWARRRRLDA